MTYSPVIVADLRAEPRNKLTLYKNDKLCNGNGCLNDSSTLV